MVVVGERVLFSVRSNCRWSPTSSWVLLPRLWEGLLRQMHDCERDVVSQRLLSYMWQRTERTQSRLNLKWVDVGGSVSQADVPFLRHALAIATRSPARLV